MSGSTIPPRIMFSFIKKKVKKEKQEIKVKAKSKQRDGGLLWA